MMVLEQQGSGQRGGDERAGYESSVDLSRRLLSARFWGFWDLRMVRECNDGLLAQYRELKAAGGPWYVLINHSRFATQKAEVQAEIAKTMSDALALGMKRAASVVGSTVTQLQLRRLGAASGLPAYLFSFFNSEEEARAWLLKT